MSAMHWEARRRQNALDRRLATKTRPGASDGQKQSTLKEGQSDPAAQTGSSEPLVVEEQILCRCQHVKKDQYSAKTENRYTATQYSQQW